MVIKTEYNFFTLFEKLRPDEKFNVITHGAGLILSLILCPFLLYSEGSDFHFFGLCVFTFGLIFMFFSSTLYHLAHHEDKKFRWRIADHSSIFLLIGGTYTPFIFYYHNTKEGISFLMIHWMIILGGILFKLIFKTKYEIFSLILYLVLGWMVVFIYDEIIANMASVVKFWLIAGGLSYTAGVYFYVRDHVKWHHGIWHIFVIMGSGGHFIALFLS